MRALRWLRDPLPQLLVLGGLIFGAYAWLRPEAAREERPTVVIEPAFVDALAAQQRQRTGQEPTEAERQALLAAWLREEALVREAHALGLAAGDPIVRRRLVQKMELWLEGTVALEEPSDEALAAYLEENAARFARPPRLRFEQVFFSREGRGDAAREDAYVARTALEGGAPAAGLGDASPFGAALGPADLPRLASHFGASFAASLTDAPLERWIGPIESGHGLHLVRVLEREPGGTPSLEAVRRPLRDAYLAEARARAVEVEIDALAAALPVTISP